MKFALTLFVSLFSLVVAADPGSYTCETTSKGYLFTESSRDPNLARQSAVNDCTSNSSTNNDLCRANLYCNDGAYYPPMTQCETNSSGYTFNETSRNAQLARMLAIQYCTSNSSTNNQQCQANAFCNDGSPVPPMVSCSTTSNGYSFSESSRDGQLARNLTISDCTSNSSTNNDQCRANVACSDSSPRPFVSCSTTSEGYSFTQSSRDSNLARNQAIAACTANSSTNNDLCRANVACTDGYARPYVTCATTSRGYSFSEDSRDEALAAQLAVSKCTSNSSTNNDECRANVYCRE